MPSPFPGMDPYLETPDLWPDVHAGFIKKIQEFLNPRLRPKYVARVEVRIFVEAGVDDRSHRVPDVRLETARKRKLDVKANPPGGLMIAEPIICPPILDDEIEETYLTIKHRESGALVAVLEVVSPTNKIPGSDGRKSFMSKRREVLNSDVHWVEIDLLRAGIRSNGPFVAGDYRILVSRSNDRTRTWCWPVWLRDKLPTIGIPLRGTDPDVPLDLSAVLDEVYDGGAYDLSIEYAQPPDPPLQPADARWARKVLRGKGPK